MEETGFLKTDIVVQTSEDVEMTGEPERRTTTHRLLKLDSSRNAAFSRFRGGGPGRPGARAYFDDYAVQDEGFDGHEDMGRGWDNGGRLRPHRGGGPPRGEKSAQMV